LSAGRVSRTTEGRRPAACRRASWPGGFLAEVARIAERVEGLKHLAGAWSRSGFDQIQSRLKEKAMNPKRTLSAFFLAPLLAAAAFAQSEPPATAPSVPSSPTAEFGRVSGGDIDMLTKHGQAFSGSIGMMTSPSQLSSGSGGNGKGFDATLGGTLVKDRVWFFGSTERRDSLFASQYAAPFADGATSRVTSRATDARLTAQLGDRQNLAASFAASRQPALTTAPTLTGTLPSSFLSLHYTGIVSSNMFISASFSELKRSTPGN
jgi:hypothetical protein